VGGSHSEGAGATPHASGNHAGGANVDEDEVDSQPHTHPHLSNTQGRLTSAVPAAHVAVAFGGSTATLAPCAAVVELSAAVSPSMASVYSVLSTSDESTSTGACLLYGEGRVVVAAARCDPSVGMHCGVPVPPGLVSISRVSVVNGQTGAIYPHGGYGTCAVPRDLGGSPTLLSVQTQPLLWNLSCLGYVLGCISVTSHCVVLDGFLVCLYFSNALSSYLVFPLLCFSSYRPRVRLWDRPWRLAGATCLATALIWRRAEPRVTARDHHEDPPTTQQLEAWRRHALANAPAAEVYAVRVESGHLHARYPFANLLYQSRLFCHCVEQHFSDLVVPGRMQDMVSQEGSDALSRRIFLWGSHFISVA